MALFFLALSLGVGALIHVTAATQEGLDRMVEKRRKARIGLPRDLAILAATTESDRRRWFRRTRRLARLLAVRHAVAAAPAIAIAAGAVGGAIAVFLPTLVVVLWVAAAVLVMGVLVVVSVREQLGTPLLLIGHVTSGLYYDERPPGETRSWKEMAFDWILHGHGRKINVEATAACRLGPDGRLISDPGWRGEHEIGVRRAIRRDLIEMETTVLVCSGAGAALYRLQQLALLTETTNRQS